MQWWTPLKWRKHHALPFKVPFRGENASVWNYFIINASRLLRAGALFISTAWCSIDLRTVTLKATANNSHNFHTQTIQWPLTCPKWKYQQSFHLSPLISSGFPSHYSSVTVSTCWFETPRVCLSFYPPCGPLAMQCVCRSPSSVFQTQSRQRRDHLDWVTP